MQKSSTTRMHSSRMRTVRSSGRLMYLGVGGVKNAKKKKKLFGGCLLWGVVCSGGCLLPGGVCSEGVSAPGVSVPGGSALEGGCLLHGVSALGGVCFQGVLLQRGGVYSGGCGIPACTEADTPTPHPGGQTDACKNITFATSLRTVITLVDNLY